MNIYMFSNVCLLQLTGGVEMPDVSSFKMTEEWVDQDGNQVSRFR